MDSIPKLNKLNNLLIVSKKSVLHLIFSAKRIPTEPVMVCWVFIVSLKYICQFVFNKSKKPGLITKQGFDVIQYNCLDKGYLNILIICVCKNIRHSYSLV